MNGAACKRKPNRASGRAGPQKGTRAEHAAIAQFNWEWWNVTRTPASLGLWDIQAFPLVNHPKALSWPRLIQVKCNRPPGGKALQEYIDGAKLFHAVCELWVRYDGNRHHPARWCAWNLRECGAALTVETMAREWVEGEGVL